MPSVSSLSPTSLRYAPYPCPSPIKHESSDYSRTCGENTTSPSIPTQTSVETVPRPGDSSAQTPTPLAASSTTTSASTPVSAYFVYRPRRNGRVFSGRADASFEAEVRRDLEWEKENGVGMHMGRMAAGLSAKRQRDREQERMMQNVCGVNTDMRADRRKSRLFFRRARADAMCGMARPNLTGLGSQSPKVPDSDDILAIPSSDTQGLHLEFASSLLRPNRGGSTSTSSSRLIDGLPVSSSAMSVDLSFDSAGRDAAAARTPGSEGFIAAVRGLQELARGARIGVGEEKDHGRMTPSSPLCGRIQQLQSLHRHHSYQSIISNSAFGSATPTTVLKHTEGSVTVKRRNFSDFGVNASDAHSQKVASPTLISTPVVSQKLGQGTLQLSHRTVRVLEGALRDLERIERDVKAVLGGARRPSAPAMARVSEQIREIDAAETTANRTQDSDNEVLGVRLTRMRSEVTVTVTNNTPALCPSQSHRPSTPLPGVNTTVPTRRNPTRTASNASRFSLTSSKRSRASSVQGGESAVGVVDAMLTTTKTTGGAMKWTRTLRKRLGKGKGVVYGDVGVGKGVPAVRRGRK